MTTANLTKIDTITARMGQVEGILAMLTDAGQGEDFGTLTHKTIMNALWAASELVDQAGAAASTAK
ncbi:MAG: hypothetical protein HHJ17_17810 [Rhodoferax sp.]|uniref:hypothetical protein n=1 Tax=Rhodoferax sp. TaxID=50421 RepID=UPI0017967CA1|nr:hypothetical protein [Rhodoferax sp.]NMM15377.1 hypothetical protein [Rhodoferax sp.]